MTAAVPWDLASPDARAWFDRCGEGLVAVLPPDTGGVVPGGWRMPNGGAWVHVGPDGTVTAFTGKVEVGQGTRAALSLLVAEELRVARGAVQMVSGDTDVCPWDMGTFGSRSMPDAGPALRRTAAAAREALIGLAAEVLGADVAALVVEDGEVCVPGEGRSVPYGDLVAGLRQVVSVAPDTALPPATTWHTAGRPASDPASVDAVTGARVFTTDLDLPGMLVGRILRPPALGATLRSVDLEAVRALPGVTVVHEGDLVAVAAPSVPGAHRALAAIRAEWDATPQPSEGEIVTWLRDHPSKGQGFWGPSHHETGDADTALEAAAVRLDATYTTAYIAHVPLETRCAIARWEDGRLTVWTGTQVPFGVRREVAGAFRMPQERVQVIVPPTGAGFGGKHTGETAIAAARLARAAGRPVKLRWTREEEFHWAYFRPYAVIDVSAGAGADGTLQAWIFRNINSGSAGIGTPYAVPHQRIDHQPAETPLPQGPYRALAATANHFARESHIDALAALLGIDPVAYRLQNLADERLAAVLRATAERAGWAEWKPEPGRGRGIACGLEKGGRIATFAEVRVDGDGAVEIVRVVTTFECGAVVHPDNLRNQVQGATIMGLGGALFEAIHFEGGRVLNGRMADYRVPRFSDVPPIEVVLLDRPDLPPAGGGETPIVAIAPALANAIFDAIGRRLRSLPLLPDGVLP